MALANRDRDVFVLSSDGEFAEGSCWESLRIAGELRLENLKIMVNANGTSAYGKVDIDLLDTRLQMFFPTLVIKTDLYRFPSYLQGFQGHCPLDIQLHSAYFRICTSRSGSGVFDQRISANDFERIR